MFYDAGELYEVLSTTLIIFLLIFGGLIYLMLNAIVMERRAHELEISKSLSSDPEVIKNKLKGDKNE